MKIKDLFQFKDQDSFTLSYISDDEEIFIKNDEGYKIFLQINNRIKLPKIEISQAQQQNGLEELKKERIQTNSNPQHDEESPTSSDLQHDQQNTKSIIKIVKFENIMSQIQQILTSRENQHKTEDQLRQLIPQLQDEQEHKYSCKRISLKKNTFFFRCTKKNCTSSLTINQLSPSSSYEINTHKCKQKQDDRLINTKIVQSEYDFLINFFESEDNLLKSTMSVYEWIITKYKDFKSSFGQIQKLQLFMRNSRWPNKKYSDNQLEEVTVQIDKQKQKFFLKKERIYIVKKKSYIEGLYFACQWGITLIVRAQQLAFDLTFKVAPQNFLQLGTLLAYDSVSNEWYPAAFCILESKDTECYTNFFDQIFKRAEQCMMIDEKNPFQFTKIFIDFELGIHNAVKQIFTHKYSIIGCYFHAIKNIWHHANSYGLKTAQHLTSTKKLIQNIKCMLHIPIQHRHMIWQQDNTIKDFKTLIHYKRFIEYIESNYIQSTSRFGALSDYSIIKFDKNENYLRTTNICEGYNLRLQNRIIKYKFRLSYVISKLQSETEYFYSRYQSKLSGESQFEKEIDLFKFSDNTVSKACESLITFIKEKKIQNNQWNLQQYKKLADYIELIDLSQNNEDEELDKNSDLDCQFEQEFEIINQQPNYQSTSILKNCKSSKPLHINININ